MSQPWFPFWVGDYVRDTARLTTQGHGAYLLLMLDYWANGAPPDDDETLASIARLPLEAWLKLRHTLAPFFQITDGKWFHGRIEKELRIAEEKHQKRVNAGKAGGEAKAKSKQSSSNANPAPPASPYQSQPQSQNMEGGGVRRVRAAKPPDAEDVVAATVPAPMKLTGKSLISADAFALATQVLAIIGKDQLDPLSVGAPLTVQGWFNGGWHRDCIVAGVKAGMQSRNGQAPSTLKYFEKAIARAHAQLTTPVPIAPADPPPRSGRALTEFQRSRNETKDILNDLEHFASSRSIGGQTNSRILSGDTGERPEGLCGGLGGDVIDLPAVGN